MFFTICSALIWPFAPAADTAICCAPALWLCAAKARSSRAGRALEDSSPAAVEKHTPTALPCAVVVRLIVLDVLWRVIRASGISGSASKIFMIHYRKKGLRSAFVPNRGAGARRYSRSQGQEPPNGQVACDSRMLALTPACRNAPPDPKPCGARRSRRAFALPRAPRRGRGGQ